MPKVTVNIVFYMWESYYAESSITCLFHRIFIKTLPNATKYSSMIQQILMDSVDLMASIYFSFVCSAHICYLPDTMVDTRATKIIRHQI